MRTPRYPDGSKRRVSMFAPAEIPPLELDGIDLTFIRIDHQTRLQFDDVELVIQTPFRLKTSAGEWMLDPEKRANLSPLLAIYPVSLASAEVDADLTLRLAFENGAGIDVPQNPYYEAWQIVGPGSRMIVCPPKGDGMLAVWL